MRLYGPTHIGRRRGARSLRPRSCSRNLDAADDVYRRINSSIDAYIEKNGIQAPAEAPYAPVWEPGEETLELDLDAANVTVVLWSVGFRSDFAWIRFPVSDERGHVRHERGVTDIGALFHRAAPGSTAGDPAGSRGGARRRLPRRGDFGAARRPSSLGRQRRGGGDVRRVTRSVADAARERGR